MAVSINDLDYNWLTYLEALYKIVEKVNEIIGVVNNLNGYAEDITAKITINQVLINEIVGNDGSLFDHIISCNHTLELPSNYVIYLYNDSQGILIPLNNKLDSSDVLEFITDDNFGTDAEFWDDCMFLAKRLI